MSHPMTITEKILAAHAGLDHVSPGDFITARVDMALANDITAPISIERFEKAGAQKVFDPERLALVADHFTPNKDVQSAGQVQILRNFANKHSLPHFYEGGDVGVEHALLPEKGMALPGDIVIGADSHTCSYGGLGAFATGVGSADLAAVMITGEIWLKVPASMKIVFKGALNPWVEAKDLILHVIGRTGVDGALYMAMEFDGPAIQALGVSGRLTMANMAVEAGAKNGIIAPDSVVREYVSDRALREFRFYESDPDAQYEKKLEIDAAAIEPQVAFPHLPENVKNVSEAGDIPIDQSVIGSCTNGRIEDLRTAAAVLKGQKAAKGVRLIVLPATPAIYRAALKEGLLEIFLDAGAVIGPPTCGPCLGGHMGVLAKGERAVATTNRNFRGRMGHPESEVYLSGAAVAAASAVAGKIAGPDETL
ncbi:3-isopropylmalate dehydratase large subunit [Candidatus Desulfarcum epimagneticum]|uniref:3-isopropylmalate dehydratase large subunit n=1 Tax=uncultured Desulfobacteraceae bacterium TaxID=218296 RepID=A0A484HNW3_9BACT|nr:3-isopropylmalate dehydratase large subunit [uncultured Desulfobacteraceae bacterium]